MGGFFPQLGETNQNSVKKLDKTLNSNDQNDTKPAPTKIKRSKKDE